MLSRKATTLVFVATVIFASTAFAQDLRNVRRPVFPPVCTTLKARLTSGKALGSISSESRLDSPRIQAALNACPAGEAVALAPSHGHNAFLVRPFTLPTGVTLIVRAGVTVYASRNPRDYDSGSSHTCGTLQKHGDGCRPLITVRNTVGSGIMGFGTIDGRGYMPLLIHGKNGPESWWQLAWQAQKLHLDQNNPRLINMEHADRFTLYGIRLMNSPTFHVAIGNSANITVWGVKIVTPYDARNSDGIDPGVSTNVTITRSHISDGDDQIAVGANNPPGAHYITVRDDWFGDGHGTSIGSYTAGGVDHLLVDHVVFSGLQKDHNATIVHVKSSANRGGLVEDLTYRDICAKNVYYPIWFDPFYFGFKGPGKHIPWYKNISVSNLHSVNPDQVIIQGYNSSFPTEVSLNNVVINGIHASNFVSKYHVTTPTHAIIHLGPGPVNFMNYLHGPGVTVHNHITNNDPPYSCPSQVFAPIMGDIIPGPSQIAPRTPPVVRVQILTTRAKPYADYLSELAKNSDATLALTPPTGTVTIYDGRHAVGKAKLAVNTNSGLESLAIPLKPLPIGIHSLTARYSGDSLYPAFSFGHYTVSIGGGTATGTTATTSSTAYTAGLPVTLSASVKAPGHRLPTGTVRFTSGAINLGSAPVNSNGVATRTDSTITAGEYAVVASFTGRRNFSASQSAPIILKIAKIPTSLRLLATDPHSPAESGVTLTAHVVYSPGNHFRPTGTITFYDGSHRLARKSVVNGSARFTIASLTPGKYIVTASYTGDADFASAKKANTAITITH